ncbi:MAG: HAMP domain-containing histidine kinase [Oscillospiraceae bacterium]|nr:HAMP domain-containing histidine kinase [Oscillospiraceae bacterium]
MTIKRRIKISNNLMIVLPMLLTLVLGGIFSLIIIRVVGIDPRPMIADRYHIPLLFLAFLLTVVYFTNRALTRYVFRGIITPIDILVNGVHEIRDGNLEFRIDYGQKDEFAAVCADFNEMAQRLSDMVNRQQREESGRRELIAGISHDLRTPLTSIKAYLEGLEKGVATSPEMQEKYLDTIKRKTSDLEYTVNQLFLFSKLDTGNFPFHLDEVDIGRELRCFVDGHEKEYGEKGLSLLFTKNVESVYVEMDVVQFRNVIMNVLDNSVKYNDHERAEVTLECRQEGGEVRIAITDNGPGVREEALAKLFDVFYRSDASRSDPSRGSGLGLAIAKKIIERLGGAIGAENASGGGLAIEITLPIIRQGDNL